MSTLPDDAVLQRQPARVEGELPSLSGEPHVRLPVPAREQSTLESLSSAFRGLGSMTRASTQQSRTTTYASFSPNLASPTFSNNLMLSDDDGGPDEGFYGAKPSVDVPGNDHIIWSGWDEVWWDGLNTPSRLLLLGYRGGIQAWDCTNEQVREVLNLLSPTLGGAVIGAAVIPAPASSQDDSLAEQRPLVGILTSRPDELVIYSLRTHNVLKRISFNSPQAIQASDQFTVISTVAPPALHILNSATFDHLSTIAAQHVALPIFALSCRLLAYASTPPPPSTSPTPTAVTQSPSKVQADISMAIEGARKVGAGMWSGVKTLLGESTVSRPPAHYSPAARSPAPLSPTSRSMLVSPRIYSRSAPSESTYSTGSSAPRLNVAATGETRPTNSQGHVTVVDLEPLLSGSSSPRRIVQHHATPGQAISALAFARTGNMLAVTGADGIFVRVFEVRPQGRYSKGGPRLAKRDELNELGERDTGSLWHWYDLQRGLTRRRVTDIVWSGDSKWITVVTVRGTLHIFAINPYGGIPTGASHLLGSGRVVNMTEPQRAPASLSPVLRIHMSGTPESQAKGVPVSVMFGRASKPGRDSGAQDVFVLNRATGELMLKQCVIRMQSASTIERSMQASISLPGALTNSVTGTGMSALSNMMRGGVGAVVGAGGGGDKAGEELVLGGVEAGARTWGLVRREKEWGEVRKAVERVGTGADKKSKASRSEWLAQAEILTCTRSPKLLPGPIYLSHQFAFYSLCEDWHALLQQSRLNLPVSRIIVRREVSARPVADSGSDGAFLGSITDAMFAVSSSLDAPLASALSASLEPSSASQQIPSFPNAYSAGKSASWKDPVRKLSHLSDGLGQGLGSLKREIGKVRPSSGSSDRRVRSPKSPSAPDTPGIKLEFDDDALFEVDEELPPGDVEVPIEGGGLMATLREDDASRSGESGTGSVPSTVPDIAPLVNPDVGGGWMGEGESVDGEDEDYVRAREEDSRFDDLVVGLMDEEEEERRVTLEAVATKKKHRKKR